MNAQQVDLWKDVPEKPASREREPLPMLKPRSMQKATEEDRKRFFAIGKERSFPKVDFSLGRSVIGTIQAGEANWQAFSQNADVYVVQVALQVVSKEVLL